MNKAPLLGVVVDARFPVIVHHRCAHDSPCTVWAPHWAYQCVKVNNMSNDIPFTVQSHLQHNPKGDPPTVVGA